MHFELKEKVVDREKPKIKPRVTPFAQKLPDLVQELKRPQTRNTRLLMRRQPKIEINSLTLTDTRSNLTHEMPVYSDKDVGLAEPWMIGLQIEARQDDDVDTDDDVYNNAQTAIMSDLKASKLEIKKKGWKNLINNCNIEDRVENPEKYDRDAKGIPSR